MTAHSWARRLFDRPATRPTRMGPARCGPAVESREDRAPPTTTPQSAGGEAEQHRGLPAPGEQALSKLVHTRRFRPATLGFWLGAVGMGAGGCLMGALMPYCHPVAMALSVLWWGTYFGVFGASVGALVGFLTERILPRPSAAWDGAGTVPTESELDACAGDA